MNKETKKRAFLAIFLINSIVLIQSCGSLKSSGRKKQRGLYTNKKSISAQKSEFLEKKSLVNPNLPFEKRKHKSDFLNPYSGRSLQYFGVERSDYNTAIRNADSGHAYDAFIASLAYWSGYYRKGKRLIFFGKKGRDRKKSLKYLHLASELGWPEASYILYQCYQKSDFAKHSFKDIFNRRDKSIRAGNLKRHIRLKSCLHSKDNWRDYTGSRSGRKFVLPLSNSKAKKYLERTAAQGAKFDKDFNYIADRKIPQFDRLDTRIKMIISQYRAQSINHLANLKAKELKIRPSGMITSKSSRDLYQENFNSCSSVIPDYLVKSEYDDKITCAKSSADKRYCPGQGYQYMRFLLNSCMILAPDQANWEFYFIERLKFFHSYFDGSPYNVNKFLNPIIARYTKLGDLNKAKWVRDIKVQALKNANSLSGTWKVEKEKRRRESQADRNARIRQEQRNKRDAEIHRQKYNSMMKQNAAEDRRLKKSWSYKPDNFSNQLQQIQNQTLQKIQANKARMQKSRYVPPRNTKKTTTGFSGIVLDSKKVKPLPKPNEGKDCIPINGSVPKNKFDSLGIEYCDWDRLKAASKKETKRKCPTLPKGYCGKRGYGVEHCEKVAKSDPSNSCHINK